MEKRLSECDNVDKELELKCEALELKLNSEIKVNGTVEQRLDEKEITNKEIEGALVVKSNLIDAMNEQLEKCRVELSYLTNCSTSTYSNGLGELIDQLERAKQSNQVLAKKMIRL